MKVDLIIQARIGSKRLPGKSLLPLAGEPLVGRIIERVKRCKNISEIIVAIPDTKENLQLKMYLEKFNVHLFCGPEDDLVERYYLAARERKSDLICRLPADNATPEPTEIDRIVKFHKNLRCPGFSSNLSQIYDSGYPDGIGAEIFDFSKLEEARSFFKEPSKREHVHLNFFDYESQKPVDNDWCPVNTINCPIEFRRPDIVLDVNNYHEYLYMDKLYQSLYYKNKDFTILDIIEWHDRELCKRKKEK